MFSRNYSIKKVSSLSMIINSRQSSPDATLIKQNIRGYSVSHTVNYNEVLSTGYYGKVLRYILGTSV
eukprot:SAG11_NODE_5030_length_1685_cov_7.857503_1_plen_67_part_00